MCVRMAYGRGNGVLFLGRRHTEGGRLSDFAMGVATAWFFFGCFYGVMDDGVTTTTIWQVWLESSLSCVLLMSLANATSLGGATIFRRVGGQPGSTTRSLHSITIFFSLFSLEDGSCGQPGHPVQLPCTDRQTGGRHSKMGSRIEHEHEHEKEKENDQRHNVTCARAPCVSVSASECPVASVSLCVSVRESGMTTMTWLAASMKWMGTNECECETGGGGSPAPQRCGGLLRQQTDLPGGSGSGSGSVWQLGAGIG